MGTLSANSTVVTFKPRPSNGWLSLAVLGVVLFLPTATTLASTSPTLQSPALLINLAISLGFGVPILLLAAWFPTMRYELSDETLSLRYGPVLNYRIPLDTITSMRRRNLSITLWSAMRLPGLALFAVPYGDVGKVRMCATAAANGILLIETADRKYGITPADEASFVAAIQARMAQ